MDDPLKELTPSQSRRLFQKILDGAEDILRFVNSMRSMGLIKSDDLEPYLRAEKELINLAASLGAGEIPSHLLPSRGKKLRGLVA